MYPAPALNFFVPPSSEEALHVLLMGAPTENSNSGEALEGQSYNFRGEYWKTRYIRATIGAGSRAEKWSSSFRNWQKLDQRVTPREVVLAG